MRDRPSALPTLLAGVLCVPYYGAVLAACTHMRDKVWAY